jgi:hypothetical protein
LPLKKRPSRLEPEGVISRHKSGRVARLCEKRVP